MSEPTAQAGKVWTPVTEAGRRLRRDPEELLRLDRDDGHVYVSWYALDEAIAAIEDQAYRIGFIDGARAARSTAVDDWLRSEEAERRLAEAVMKAPLQDWRRDDYGKRYAHAILAALRGER